MALDWKAFVSFGGKDQISKAVGTAAKNTEKSAGKMGDAVAGAGKKVDGLKSKFSDLGTIAGGVAIGNLISSGVQKAAAAMKNLVMSVDEFAVRADNIRVSAMKVGLSSEGFQRLTYAANTSNVATEKLAAGFNALNKNLGSGALVKHLDGTNKALLDQVKSAETNEQAFMTIADAISKETDIAKRAALGNAAFGKSWAELYPMLVRGAEGIQKAADAIPNLISEDQIAAAQLWNSTIGEIKRNLQAFGDVMRNAVINTVGPYLLQLQNWIVINREMINQKIAEAVQKAVVIFKRMVSIIQDLIKKLQAVIKFFKDWGPIILAVGGTIGVLFGIVKAVIAIKNAVMVAKAAFAILNAVMAVNPVMLIVMAVAAAIAGFVLLTKKVGSFKAALEVVAQTIMKYLLAPLNLVLDAVQGLMLALGHVPGMGWAKTAGDEIGGFQDKINTALTGSTGTFAEGGVRGAVAGYESGGVAGAIKGYAGGVYGVVAESYGAHRAAYLEEHPEAAGIEAGEEAKWEEALALLKEQNKLTEANTGAINDLADASPNSPKKLRWAAMGVEDFFSTMRAGT